LVTRKVWDYREGVGNVATGGYWWSYNDNTTTTDLGPGASTNDFPITSATADVIGPWAEAAGGIVINYTIGGSNYLFPFAGIAFSWVLSDPITNTEIIAPQTWTNFCVTYSLTGTVPMKLQINNQSIVNGDNPRSASMPVQSMKETCFPATAFVQGIGWGTPITLAIAMAKSTGMKFFASLTTPSPIPKTCKLTIQSISTK
jgi:hypothetical protein